MKKFVKVIAAYTTKKKKEIQSADCYMRVDFISAFAFLEYDGKEAAVFSMQDDEAPGARYITFDVDAFKDILES